MGTVYQKTVLGRRGKQEGKEMDHSHGENTIWNKAGRKVSLLAVLIRIQKGMRDKLLLQLRQEYSRQSKEQV